MRLSLPRSLGRDHTRLWLANGISGLGDGVTSAAGPLLMTSLTRDPRLITGAVVAQFVPAVLFSLPAGAIVDRLDKRHVAMGADLLRLGTTGLLATLVATGHVRIWMVYVLLFLEGLGAIADRTSGPALTPGLVSREDLPVANARQFATGNITVFLVGPPVGAALFLAGHWVPFAVDAASFLGSFLVLGGMRWNEPERTAKPATVLSDVKEGVRFLWGHPALRVLALCIFVMNVTLGADMSVLVIYSERHLHAGAAGYGTLLTAIAVGGLACSPFTSRLIRRWGMPTLIRVGLCVEALTHLGLAIAPDLAVAYAVMFAFGIHDAVWNVTTSSLRQSETPDGMQARTAATNGLFSLGGHAIGALLGGILVAAGGVLTPYRVGFVVVGALVLVAWRPFGHTAARHSA